MRLNRRIFPRGLQNLGNSLLRQYMLESLLSFTEIGIQRTLDVSAD
jgi:hypothetical protein